MGYYNQMKCNQANYMDQPYEADKWYKFDILLDWDEDKIDSKVAVFINGTYAQNTPFYSIDRDSLVNCDEAFVNTIMLYNLTPGSTSAFKDIRLCTDLCPGTQESEFPLIRKPKTDSTTVTA